MNSDMNKIFTYIYELRIQNYYAFFLHFNFFQASKYIVLCTNICACLRWGWDYIFSKKINYLTISFYQKINYLLLNICMFLWNTKLFVSFFFRKVIKYLQERRKLTDNGKRIFFRDCVWLLRKLPDYDYLWCLRRLFKSRF